MTNWSDVLRMAVLIMIFPPCLGIGWWIANRIEDVNRFIKLKLGIEKKRSRRKAKSTIPS